MFRVIVVLTVLFAAAVVAQSPSGNPPAPPGTRDPRQSAADADAPPLVSIRGLVVSADGNLPLRRARVLVSAGMTLVGPVFTGPDGRFSVAIQQRESVTLSISKGGFAAATTRIRSRDDVALQVRLRRAAVIVGRVTDASGAPIAGQSVNARFADIPDGPDFADPATALEIAMGGSRTFFFATTDDRGEYRLGGLPAGTYRVSVLPSSIIASSPENRVIVQTRGATRRTPQAEVAVVVSAGTGQEIRADVSVNGRINPTGLTRRMYSIGGTRRLVVPTDAADQRAIEGTIVDEYGEPLQGVDVHALFLFRQGGRFAATRILGPRPTDDRGHYRIFGLPPGRYLVMADAGAQISAGGPGTSVEFTPVYYPGTPQSAYASVVDVADADAAGISFTLAPSPAIRLAGLALDSAGSPLRGSIRLVPAAGGASVALESASTRTDAIGGFVLPPVPPGAYVLQASKDSVVRGGFEAGSAHVTLSDRDPPPVIVRTSAGVRVEGRLGADGDPEPLWCLVSTPEPPHTCTRFASGAFSLAAVPLEPDRLHIGAGEPGIVLSSTGTFYADNLRGRMAIALRRAPEGWFLKSVTIGGTDVTDVSFDFSTVDGTLDDAEVIVSPDGASVAGRVVDDRGAPASGGAVVVFPAFRDRWTPYSRHTKTSAVDRDGTFTIGGLPPGEYYVASLEGLDVAVDEWQHADILAPLLSRATQVTLGEGESRTVDVEK